MQVNIVRVEILQLDQLSNLQYQSQKCEKAFGTEEWHQAFWESAKLIQVQVTYQVQRVCLKVFRPAGERERESARERESEREFFRF